jgi:signal transduction histidine kinase
MHPLIGASQARETAAAGPRSRLVGFGALIYLLIVFALDAWTGPSFSNWPYAVAIVFAAMTPSRRLALTLATAALAANLLAIGIDWFVGDLNWTPEYIQNRVLAVVSIAVIYKLTIAVQEATARSARMTALQIQNARELAISRAADRIVASLGDHRVEATIVSEAVNVFGARAALWLPAGPDGAIRAVKREAGIGLSYPDGGAAALGELLYGENAAESGPAWISAPPPLQRLGFASGLAILAVPVQTAKQLAGVLFVAAEQTDDSAIPAALSFARIAASAIDESRLLAELSAHNARLRERQHVIQDLVDAISHDVRTPLEALTMTMGQALAGDYGPLPAGYLEVLGESRISIADIQRLAETLLLVARFESGSASFNVELCALDAIVEELAVEFRALAAARSISLQVDVDEQALVDGPRLHLRRAVTNLIANAVRHTPPGGTVHLRVRKQGARVSVCVEDDGFGVDAATRPMLFQRFARGIGTGSGLGLYIARRVAESMGGQVAYAPLEPRGSSFSMMLPAHAGTEIAA